MPSPRSGRSAPCTGSGPTSRSSRTSTAPASRSRRTRPAAPSTRTATGSSGPSWTAGIWADHPHFAALPHARPSGRPRPAPGLPAGRRPGHRRRRPVRRDRPRHARRRDHRRRDRPVAGRAPPAGRSGSPPTATTSENPHEPLRVPREVGDTSLLAGMAPRARLVSLKVLGAGGTTEDRVSRLIRALAYVRAGQRRGRRGDAHPRRQPQRRLRVRPGVVRLRAEPAVQGGRQAGPVGRGGRRRGRQLRLRHADHAHRTRPTGSASA